MYIELMCMHRAGCLHLILLCMYISCIIKRINILIKRSAVVLISSAQSLNLNLHKTFRSTFVKQESALSINNDLGLKGIDY